MQKTGGAFSLRLGHARVLTPHRGVIHCARAASLRLPYNQFFYHTNNAERAASIPCLIVGAMAIALNRPFMKIRFFTGGRPMVAPTGLCVIYNFRVTLSGEGMFANAGRGRRPRRPESDGISARYRFIDVVVIFCL